MTDTTRRQLTKLILGAHVPLRLFVVFGMLVGMLGAIVPGASAALVSKAEFTAGGVLVAGVYYAKSGTRLTLTVTTDADTKCVELTGDHKTELISSTARTSWTFTLSANGGNGAQHVTATAYKQANPNGKCVANQGETPGSQSASYTLDNTGPNVTGMLVPTPNTAGWNKSDVAITWTATDQVGIGTITPTSDSVSTNTTTAGVTKTAIATDKLGNSATGSVTVKLDENAPTITTTRDPAANSLGWNNTNVTVSITCSDVLSGIKSCTGGGTVVLSAEGANQSVAARSVDNADNNAAASVGPINIDKTAPILTGAAATNPNAAGWYKGDVTVTWAASDGLSGLAGAALDASTVTGEGANLSASTSVSDKAGNTTSTTVSGIKIDRTAPTTGISGTSNSWVNGDVTVTLAPVDPLSGIAATFYTVDGGAAQTGTSFTLSVEGDHTVTYWSTDRAGNAEAPKTARVKIDTAAPTIRHTFTPETYTDGAWTNGAVTVTFICADSGSGVASCTTPVTKTTEGAGQQVVGTATDNASNSASDTATINIDKTKPTIAVSADREANTNDWYRGDVTVGFVCDDALSGVATCTPPKTLGEGANQSHTGTVTDNAGNSASAEVTGINVDKTKPILSGTPSTTGWSRGDVTVTWAASDGLAGLAGAAPTPSTVTGEGDNLSTSTTVTDKAGNTTTTTVAGIKIDRTAPSTSASVPAPLPTGWYAGAVEVTLTAADSLSGIAKTYYSVDGGEAQEYTGKFTHSLKGEHTITFWSVDVAGNTEDKTASGHSITLKLDGTPPTTTISLPAAFASGWYADTVTVAFAAVDAESGVAKTYYRVDGNAVQLYDGTFTHTLDGTHTITFWSVDVAGNVEDQTNAANSVVIKVDTAAPTITGSRTPAANGFGWNNTNVTVSFVCADSQSGVAIENCTPDTPVTNEGAGQSVSGTAKDNVGKTASTTVGDINIDKTAPTLRGAATTSPNTAGWYKGDISVAWTGQDGLSGIDPATQPANSVIKGEGASLGASAKISDKAGNVGSGSVSDIKIDRTAPSISGSTVNEDGTARSANWYNSAVRVRFACSDALSGMQECASDVVLNQDGANQSASGKATDMADNTASATVSGISIDSKAPQTSANNQCDGKNGWCKGQTATVTLTAVDQAGLSGVKEIHYFVNGNPEKVATGASTTITVPLAAKSGLATVEYFAVDNAGNVESKGGVSLKYDNIAPTVTHTVHPAANAAGWSNANTTVHFDAKDDDGGSGVDPATVTPDVIVSDETAATGRVVNGSADDLAGNTGGDSVTIKLDKTKPTISAVASGKQGSNGWYTGPVTVTFTCADTLSTIATCPAAEVLNTDGTGQAVTGTAVDRAGNVATVTISGISIDSTKPVITVSTVKASYTLGEAVSITCTATDATSGVDANGCKVTIAGGTANGVGPFTYTATATDKAGNVQTTATGGYTVTYRWAGFSQPINDTAHQIDQGVSIFKGGSTVPVKFQLKDAAGTVVQAASAPQWLTPVKGSATSVPVGEIVYSDPATTGGTYRYDATAQQYIYNWSTKGLASGFYYRIGVKLDDGQTYYVNIGLR